MSDDPSDYAYQPPASVQPAASSPAPADPNQDASAYRATKAVASNKALMDMYQRTLDAPDKHPDWLVKEHARQFKAAQTRQAKAQAVLDASKKGGDR